MFCCQDLCSKFPYLAIWLDRKIIQGLKKRIRIRAKKKKLFEVGCWIDFDWKRALKFLRHDFPGRYFAHIWEFFFHAWTEEVINYGKFICVFVLCFLLISVDCFRIKSFRFSVNAPAGNDSEFNVSRYRVVESLSGFYIAKEFKFQKEDLGIDVCLFL